MLRRLIAEQYSHLDATWRIVEYGNLKFQNGIALLFLTKHEISDRGLLIFFLVAAWRFPQCDLAVQPDCLSAIADPKKCSAILRRRVRSTAEAQTVFCTAGSTCSVFYDVRRLSDGDPSSLVCSIGIPFHISLSDLDVSKSTTHQTSLPCFVL